MREVAWHWSWNRNQRTGTVTQLMRDLWSLAHADTFVMVWTLSREEYGPVVASATTPHQPEIIHAGLLCAALLDFAMCPHHSNFQESSGQESSQALDLAVC
jgi:hypothetical protein